MQRCMMSLVLASSIQFLPLACCPMLMMCLQLEASISRCWSEFDLRAATSTKVSGSITRSNIASVCVCRFIEPGSMSQTMSGQVWVMPGCYWYSPGLGSNSHCSWTCCLLLAVCWAILAVISRCLPPPTLPACPLTNCNCCAHTVMEPYLEM